MCHSQILLQGSMCCVWLPPTAEKTGQLTGGVSRSALTPPSAPPTWSMEELQWVGTWLLWSLLGQDQPRHSDASWTLSLPLHVSWSLFCMTFCVIMCTSVIRKDHFIVQAITAGEKAREISFLSWKVILRCLLHYSSAVEVFERQRPNQPWPSHFFCTKKNYLRMPQGLMLSSTEGWKCGLFPLTLGRLHLFKM